MGCTTFLATSCASGSQEVAGSAIDRPAGSSTPGSTTAPAPLSQSVHPVTTVVISDDAAAVGDGQPAAEGWPRVLAASLAGAGTPLQLEVAAADAGGYAGDPTFTELVRDTVVESTQLVVFYETAVGSASAAAVAEGAEDAFAAVERQAPDAVVVVVAPWASGNAPVPSDAVRDAVRAAADDAEVSVTYIDPVGDGWARQASQRQIADLMYADVADLVAALATSGAFE